MALALFAGYQHLEPGHPRQAARGLCAQSLPPDPGGLHPRLPRAEADMLLHGREGALREGALGVLHGAHDLCAGWLCTQYAYSEETCT